jgi:hypothetical protein
LLRRRASEKVACVDVTAQQRFDALTQGRIAAASLVEESRPLGGVVPVQGLEENRPFAHRGTLRCLGHVGNVPRGALLSLIVTNA